MTMQVLSSVLFALLFVARVLAAAVGVVAAVATVRAIYVHSRHGAVDARTWNMLATANAISCAFNLLVIWL